MDTCSHGLAVQQAMLFGTNRSCAASSVTVGKRGKAHRSCAAIDVTVGKHGKAHSVVSHHKLR